MPALTVTKSLRNGALALALIGGAALLPQPASADSFQEGGDFGGTWTRIGPSDQAGWRHERHYGAPIYVAPAYAYELDYAEPGNYGPPGYYDYGPGIAIGGPDIGFSVGID
jgi:hypothetical protein